METIEEVLERVSDFRKKKGFSHENMAVELGISQAAYTNMERNESKLSVERLIKISEILEEPIYRFFQTSPNKINHLNNYDSSVGYLQDFENLYQDSKETNEKLEEAYKNNIQTLKEENAFLKKLIEEKN